MNKDDDLAERASEVSSISPDTEEESHTPELQVVNDRRTLPNTPKAASTPRRNASLETEPETAHVLLMDIVGFSKLLVSQQAKVLHQLNEIVSQTEEYRRIEAKNRLLHLPTGDGMALVFFTSNPLAAVRCAQQICRALKNNPIGVGLRMGINSGPVSRVRDLRNRANITGDGINFAQRVMDCGDANHILLSHTVAEYLRSYDDQWAKQLRDLKVVKVKHKKRVHLFNLVADDAGNHRVPAKVRRARFWKAVRIAAIPLLALVLGLAAYAYFSARPDPIDSVAVLLNADPSTQSVGNTITDGLNRRLSRLPNIKRVISRDSLSRYRGQEIDPQVVGREQSVQAVLKGTITRSGDELSINVDLIDVRNNREIWSGHYSRRASDRIDAQIVEEIAAQLKLKLSDEQRKAISKHYTDNAEAYRLYSEGRYSFEKRKKDDLRASIESLEKAVSKDPNFALAYAALADSYNISAGYSLYKPGDAYENAKRAARSALDIDPSLADAHNALAYALANYDWNWTEAENHFNLAIALDPNKAEIHYARAFNYLISKGRISEAINEMKRATELAPLSLIINTNLGWTYYYDGQYDAAIEQYRKALEIDPDFTTAHLRLIEAYEQQGKYEEAIAEFPKMTGLKDEATRSDVLKNAYAAAGVRGYWQNRINLALQTEADGDYVSSCLIASLYAMLGDKTRALQRLDQAVKNRDEGLIKIAVNPRFESLRSDQHFQEIKRQVGVISRN